MGWQHYPRFANNTPTGNFNPSLPIIHDDEFAEISLILMAVYTKLTAKDLTPWFSSLGLGKVESLRGIQEGIENSNYFIKSQYPNEQTSSSDFVLTIFERTTPDHFAFYLAWLTHLHHGGLAVPYPVAHGQLLGKPALIATRLLGEKNLNPTPAHCYAVGAWLATLHQRGAPQVYSNNIPCQPRSIAWQKALLPTLRGKISTADWQLAEGAGQAIWDKLAQEDLPRGAIHADLFRDNLLFTPATFQISGVFDFFFGGEDTLLYDIAVSINDWCAYQSPQCSLEHASALIQGYQSVRTLTWQEIAIFPLMMQLASLRFFLSRLADVAYPREGLLSAHDPKRFGDILREHNDHPLSVSAIFRALPEIDEMPFHH